MRWWAALLLCASLLAQDELEDVVYSVKGVVVDAKGRARAGAMVRLWDALFEERFLGQGTTDAAGKFEIALTVSAAARREHPFGPIDVLVRGKGLAQVRTTVTVGGDAVRIEAPDGAVLGGRVTDPEGNAVPAAVVRAAGRETTTDEEGRFSLLEFAARSAELTVRARGFKPWTGTATDIRLTALKRKSGRITDAVTGEPIAGALILPEVAGAPPVAGITDEDGRYEVASAGESFLAHAPGYRAGRGALPPAPPVRGRVTNEAGDALPSCPVTLLPERGPSVVVRTDEKGRFEFRVVPPGRLRLRAVLRNYVPAVRFIHPAWKADPVEVTMARGRKVAGAVDAPGVRVSFLGTSEEARLTAIRPVPAHGHEVAFAYADLHGRFVARSVPKSATHVVAWDGKRRSLPVPLGPPLRLALLDELPLPGVLASDSGEPLAGVRLTCGAKEETTGTDGRFRFDGLAPGSHRLRGQPQGHAPIDASAWAGDATRVTARSRFGDKTLEVSVDAEWLGPALVTVRRAKAPHVSRRRTLHPAQREAVFTDLPPGSYSVRVSAGGYLEAVALATVGAAGGSVTITPAHPGTLSLRTSPGAVLLVQTVTGRPAPVGTLRLKGGWKKLSGFGPGRYRFISRARGELVVVREIDVEEKAAPETIDLRGGAASTLAILVRDAAGEAVGGAGITMETDGGFRWPVSEPTDESGRARLTRLIAGAVTIRARAGDREGADRITVGPGMELKLEIVVR